VPPVEEIVARNAAARGGLDAWRAIGSMSEFGHMETGMIDDSFTAHCGGGANFYGHYYHCHATHGAISLHRGIAQSCDVYFYNVGNRLGIDNIAFYADKAGYGQRTGVDLPNEAEGVVPSSQWKIRNFRQKWYAGETISVSIGQGAVTITPIQLAHAIGGLAMGGVWYKPHLVKGHEEPPRRWALDPANVQKVMDGMWGVVNEAGSTGVRAQLPGIEVCGKTGTAQTGSPYPNGWFAAYAGKAGNKPDIAVVVLVEHSREGSEVSGPIARRIIEAYYGLPQEPWPDYWTGSYDPMLDPTVTDGVFHLPKKK